MFRDVDFCIKLAPDDTDEIITQKIFYSWIIKRRLKANKPAIFFISGDSGEGKSLSAIAIQFALMLVQGLDIRKYFDLINVYTPLEYPKKLNLLLHEKEFKKVNVITVHEARELVGAKNWYTFLTRTIADVNAMSRGIKRLCIMIISQFIRDISTDIRYSINYYVKVQRPYRKRARLFINVLWKDDYDLEKPKLRRRKLRGLIIYPNGRRRLFTPRYLEIDLPPADLIKIFEERDQEAKTRFIRKKLDNLIREMEIELGLEDHKINALVNWLTKPENSHALLSIGKHVRKKWRMTEDSKRLYGLTDSEAQEVENLLPKKMRQLNMIEDAEELPAEEPKEEIGGE